jgi:hypothetical protein
MVGTRLNLVHVKYVLSIYLKGTWIVHVRTLYVQFQKMWIRKGSDQLGWTVIKSTWAYALGYMPWAMPCDMPLAICPRLVCKRYIPVCTSMYSECTSFVHDTDKYILVYTWFVFSFVHTWLYCTESCFTGFCGSWRDANARVPDIHQPPADFTTCSAKFHGQAHHQPCMLLTNLNTAKIPTLN